MHCMIFITEKKFSNYVAFDESLFKFVKRIKSRTWIGHELAYLHVLVTNIDIFEKKKYKSRKHIL